ncbi:MAG: aminotransferase class I/II-fold pyridoxal phosphate-dependent enzyme [Candidatus Hydrogenedentes bacterium]|nr:aminotransferase class I/II-fold pyridoxal phosphate-dependent enzyme [Candidatus Hydrogenedentota bacterium]
MDHPPVPPTALPFQHAFDAETFRANGHRVIDMLADYLDAASSGTPMPVLPWLEPQAMVDSWPGDFPEEPTGALHDILQLVVREANHLHHPRYMGHQVPGPLPAAALCDMVGALLNNGMAVYEMGMSGTAMECRVIAWMAQLLGFDSQADGVLTSGGSIGNLTAFLAMRHAKGADSSDKLPAVLVSDQAHYSVRRAVKIMGWGDDGAITVPCDAQFKLCVDALPERLRHAESLGRRVIGVVGSACTTPTGTYDPLDAIADFCAANDLWLHVDAAHGAPAALSETYRPLLRGVERADSVVFDAHKMLLMPALVTAVLFRNGDDSYRAFEQRASYLFVKSPREEWYNIGHRTIECTKRMLSLKVYTALMCYGTRFFADYVTRQYDLARRFATMLREAPDFELAAEPEANIVCFRHTPNGAGDLDAAGLFMRTTLINPLTTEEHLVVLLACIREEAKRAREEV